MKREELWVTLIAPLLLASVGGLIVIMIALGFIPIKYCVTAAALIFWGLVYAAIHALERNYEKNKRGKPST